MSHHSAVVTMYLHIGTWWRSVWATSGTQITLRSPITEQHKPGDTGKLHVTIDGRETMTAIRLLGPIDPSDTVVNYEVMS